MATLRSVKLLNDVEAGIISGAQLETLLEDEGRQSGLTGLLTMRAQTRRMAASTTAVAAFIESTTAHGAAFRKATDKNSTMVQALVADSDAMVIFSLNESTLNIVVPNRTSWRYFKSSDFYETNIIAVVSTLAGVTPLPASMAILVADDDDFALVAESTNAMKAMVESTASCLLMAGDAVAMALVADVTVAIEFIAAQTSIMPDIAASTVAMAAIVTRPVAMSKMANAQGAVQAIANVPSAWTSFQGSAYFAENLKVIIANVAGLTPGDYLNIDAMIADTTALTAIAANTQAVEALITSGAAVTTLSTSANISIITGSATAMAVVGADESIMLILLEVQTAVVALFASSPAKGFIVTSTTLVDAVAGNAATVAYLKSIMSSPTIPTNINVVGTANKWGGIPKKVITINMRANNIGAIAATYTFTGASVAGSAIPSTIALSGTGTQEKIMGYTVAKWQVSGISATAAASPEWTYVDMT